MALEIKHSVLSINLFLIAYICDNQETYSMKDFAKLILLSTALFFWYAAHSQCPDSVNVSFNNITPAPNPGCNSTTGVFQNTSGISLSNVQSFMWTYGDGTASSGTEDSSDQSSTYNQLSTQKWQIRLPEVSGTYMLVILSTEGRSKQIIEVR